MSTGAPFTPAVNEVAAALDKLAKLHNVAAALPERIASAEAELQEAIDRLGFPLPGTRRGRRVGGAGRPRADQPAASPRAADAPRSPGQGGRPLGELALCLLDVIQRAGDHGASTEDIAEASGVARRKIQDKLRALSTAAAPRVVLDEGSDPPVWRLTGPVPELAGRSPLRAAMLDAAGVEAA